ncbi:helix-turn-helix domain-containing protein [Azorhizophilus paspali]|uniref:Helix-turn-helix domain-containing protein n=1 Tax=Azorhizophilus paspali TaxID=69963 RepID=A0ABV6SKW7_AZOPA
MASPSNTLQRYFAMKTKWTCILKMQCRPRRISLSLLIDQEYERVMQRLQAFKFELRPDSQQERQMRRFAGSCRFVFNKALALRKERCEQGGLSIVKRLVRGMGTSMPIGSRQGLDAQFVPHRLGQVESGVGRGNPTVDGALH